MKKILSSILSLICVINLSFLVTAWAMSGTENYIIDQCDYEDGKSNWKLLLDSGVLTG